jgi:uncharacterized Tic20 family protein
MSDFEIIKFKRIDSQIDFLFAEGGIKNKGNPMPENISENSLGQQESINQNDQTDSERGDIRQTREEFNKMNTLLHSSALLGIYVPFVTFLAAIYFWITDQSEQKEMQGEIKKVLDFTILCFLINFILSLQPIFLFNLYSQEFLYNNSETMLLLYTKILPAVKLLFAFICAIQITRAYKGIITKYPLSQFSIIGFIIKKAEQAPKK